MKGTLLQVNISRGGMPKLPVLIARVSAEGVAGDWQTNRKYHGGPNRAICIYSIELYDEFRREGIDLLPGSFGENFTTQGLDLRNLKPGQRFRVGGCAIELTDIRVPCRNLNQWSPDLLQRIKGRSGWLAKVIEHGDVKAGDSIEAI